MGSSPIRVAIFLYAKHLTRQAFNMQSMFASVAQLVEQWTENPRVVGSIPTGGTRPVTPVNDISTVFIGYAVFRADLAHLVERDLAKVEVAGSSPVIRSSRFFTIVSVRRECSHR